MVGGRRMDGGKESANVARDFTNETSCAPPTTPPRTPPTVACCYYFNKVPSHYHLFNSSPKYLFVFIFILCFSFFYSFVTPSQSYPLSSAYHLIHHQHYITIAIPTQPLCSPSIHYYYHTTIHHHTHHNHSSLAPPPFTTTIITHTTTITDELLITSLQLLIETLQLRLEIYCLERNSEFIIKRLINENFSVLIVDWSLNGVTSGAVYKDFVSFDLNGGFSGGGEMEQVHQMVSYRCHGFYPSILLHPWILTYLLHASNYTYTYT